MFTHPLLIQNLGSRVPSGSQFWIIGTFLVTFTTLLLCLGFFHLAGSPTPVLPAAQVSTGVLDNLPLRPI